MDLIESMCAFVFSVPIVLVGNKTDLHLERKISTEEGRRLAERWRAAFVETSAKRNEVRKPVTSFLNNYYYGWLKVWIHKKAI